MDRCNKLQQQQAKTKRRMSCATFLLLLWATIFWFGLKMLITSIEANDLNNVWEIQTWGKKHDEDDWKLLEMAPNKVHLLMCKHNQNVKLFS
jgi:hypothetical protein